MEKLHSNRKFKKLIITIVVLMLCNFAMPNFIIAVSTEEGGSAVEPLAEFLCFIPDVVNNLLQKMFIAPVSIDEEYGEYTILYSPGIIFSGTVPALNANFFNPIEKKIGHKKIPYSEKRIDKKIEDYYINSANFASINEYNIAKDATVKILPSYEKYTGESTSEEITYNFTYEVYVYQRIYRVLF